jgi:hypothetical protein
MKKVKYDTWKETLKALPDQQAPDHIWENVESDLEWRKSLESLPTFDAPTLKSGPLQNKTIYMISLLTVLIGFTLLVFFYQKSNNPPVDKTQYAAMPTESNEPKVTLDTQFETFCTQIEIKCQAYPLEEIAQSWKAINHQYDEIMKAQEVYGEADFMKEQILILQLEQTELINQTLNIILI